MTLTPAIATLSDAELAFVTAILDLGGPQHAPEAAMRAGLASTVSEAEYVAALLLSHPRIAKAITAAIKHRFNVAAAGAFNTLLEICANVRAPANARITAAQEILSRSEIGPLPSRSAPPGPNDSGVESLLDKLEKLDRLEREKAARDGAPTILDVTPQHDHDSE